MRRQPQSKRKDEEVVWIVAHEVGHALQAQHFRLPKPSRIANEDARLAALAMIEGDAMLSMIAFVAHENHVPLHRALASAADRVSSRQVEQFASASGTSRTLLKAPRIMRERVMFPYLRGITFMGAMHRAGGFGLVNRVYEHPPTTTEQILHPERYLAGDSAIAVTEPTPPAGYESAATGVMGELQIIVALGECIEERRARAAAEGWGGDAFLVARRANSRLALLWSTIWDDEREAREFSKALEAAAGCWAAGDKSSGGHFDPSRLVIRDGTKVAFVRGLPHSELEPVARNLLALPAAGTASTAPFGAVSIPALKRSVRTRPPYVALQTFVDERLGIAAPVLPGYRATIEDGELVMNNAVGRPGTAAITVSEWLVDQHTLKLVFVHFERGVRDVLDDGDDLRIEETSATETPLGRAIYRTWRIQGLSTRIRATVLPICRGMGSIVFSQVWADDRGRIEMETWMQGVRALSAHTPPICAHLDP